MTDLKQIIEVYINAGVDLGDKVKKINNGLDSRFDLFYAYRYIEFWYFTGLKTLGKDRLEPLNAYDKDWKDYFFENGYFDEPKKALLNRLNVYDKKIPFSLDVDNGKIKFDPRGIKDDLKDPESNDMMKKITRELISNELEEFKEKLCFETDKFTEQTIDGIMIHYPKTSLIRKAIDDLFFPIWKKNVEAYLNKKIKYISSITDMDAKLTKTLINNFEKQLSAIMKTKNICSLVKSRYGYEIKAVNEYFKFKAKKLIVSLKPPMTRSQIKELDRKIKLRFKELWEDYKEEDTYTYTDLLLADYQDFIVWNIEKS